MEGEKRNADIDIEKNNSTGGRVALRAWDIWAENGGEWARERRWGAREAVGRRRSGENGAVVRKGR